MTERFRAANPLDLELAIQGLTGPVTTEELLAAARAAGADPRVLATFAHLPDRQWSSASEALAAATDGWEPRG